MSGKRIIEGLQAAIAGDYRERAVQAHPSLSRGQVWCRTCGATRKVDSALAMRHGWPKCCSYTMTIDSPEEQVVLARKAAAHDKPPADPGTGEHP